MSADTDKGLVARAEAGPLACGRESALTQHVAAVKQAWRRHARSMTWEQKIAAIMRMRERQATIRRARESG